MLINLGVKGLHKAGGERIKMLMLLPAQYLIFVVVILKTFFHLIGNHLL